MNDISAEDYQPIVEDHAAECRCTQCQIFEELLALEAAFADFLLDIPVDQKYEDLVRKKFEKYTNQE